MVEPVRQAIHLIDFVFLVASIIPTVIAGISARFPVIDLTAHAVVVVSST